MHSILAVMPAQAGIPFIGFADDFDGIPSPRQTGMTGGM
jgi:hypothetical protein